MGFHIPPGGASQGSQYPPQYSTLPNPNDGSPFQQPGQQNPYPPQYNPGPNQQPSYPPGGHYPPQPSPGYNPYPDQSVNATNSPYGHPSNDGDRGMGQMAVGMAQAMMNKPGGHASGGKLGMAAAAAPMLAGMMGGKPGHSHGQNQMHGQGYGQGMPPSQHHSSSVDLVVCLRQGQWLLERLG